MESRLLEGNNKFGLKFCVFFLNFYRREERGGDQRGEERKGGGGRRMRKVLWSKRCLAVI